MLKSDPLQKKKSQKFWPFLEAFSHFLFCYVVVFLLSLCPVEKRLNSCPGGGGCFSPAEKCTVWGAPKEICRELATYCFFHFLHSALMHIPVDDWIFEPNSAWCGQGKLGVKKSLSCITGGMRILHYPSQKCISKSSFPVAPVVPNDSLCEVPSLGGVSCTNNLRPQGCAFFFKKAENPPKKHRKTATPKENMVQTCKMMWLICPVACTYIGHGVGGESTQCKEPRRSLKKVKKTHIYCDACIYIIRTFA